MTYYSKNPLLKTDPMRFKADNMYQPCSIIEGNMDNEKAVIFALLGSAHVKNLSKMLVKLKPGLNFIIVLHTAFAPADPNSVKRY